jgi:ribonuclease P protein component
VKGPGKVRFQQILDEGKRISGPTGRLVATTGSGLVGIGAAKRIGNLPRRNVVKRRARNILVQHSGWIDFNLDYILILGEAAGATEFSVLVTQLETLFVKMNDRWEKK